MLRNAIAIDFADRKTVFIIPNHLLKLYRNADGPIYESLSLLALEDYVNPDFNDKSLIFAYQKQVKALLGMISKNR